MSKSREERLAELEKRESRPTVVVDWDGTCVPNAWPDRPTEWLPGAKEALRELLDAGFKVHIHSVRLHELDINMHEPNPSRDEDFRYVRSMLDEAGLHEVGIRWESKPPAVAYVDDRGVHFNGTNWRAITDALLGRGVGQVFPSDSAARKGLPVVTGVLDYFSGALAAVAAISKYGNDKHNPGEALHWSRGKSNDHADAIGRHLIDRGLIDPDTGMRHSAELAWRALALLQVELEEAGEAPMSRGSR